MTAPEWEHETVSKWKSPTGQSPVEAWLDGLLQNNGPGSANLHTTQWPRNPCMGIALVYTPNVTNTGLAHLQ